MDNGNYKFKHTTDYFGNKNTTHKDAYGNTLRTSTTILTISK